MTSFTQLSTSPAIKSQVAAQFALLSDVSNTMLGAVQKLNALNIQVAKTVMEESLSNARQLFSSTNPRETLAEVASQARPATEKIRAYNQHVQNIIAETQVDIARTTEQHLPETTRAAEAVVKELAEKASEETEKAAQRQFAALDKLTKPFNNQFEHTTADEENQQANHA